MKKVLLGTLVVLLIVLLVAGVSYSQKKATKESCVALVQKAMAYYKEAGPEKALEEFSNPKGRFVDGEDYLSIYSLQGKVIGHGTNQKLIGKELADLKDSNGKLFIREFMDKASKSPSSSGWVDYHWTNPISKKIEPKTAYFERAGNWIIQAGYYK